MDVLCKPLAVQFQKTQLEGVILIEPRVFGDDRGFFMETFRSDLMREHGIDCEFVQDNHSRSLVNTVRALHFQTSPGQPKLVRVARGSVFDVTVDLRRSSLTFGQWQGFELSDENGHMLFVPIGFAHGFAVTSDVADVVYKVGSYYDPATERGLAWDDPAVGVKWPVTTPVLSDRDRANPTLADLDLPAW